MKFTQYTLKELPKVLRLLEKHIDFTPDVAAPIPGKNLELFKDSDGSGDDYILISEDGAHVFAYMAVTKRDLGSGESCFFVYELYVKDDGHAEEYAKRLLTEFETSLFETNALCGLVYPGSECASTFWEANGYCFSPERSIFTNAEDEPLAAYYKQLIRRRTSLHIHQSFLMLL